MLCLPARADEENARRNEVEKIKRELEIQVDELKEDLETEKAARAKAESSKRTLSEVRELVGT